jgi:hypothetical protein
MCLNRKTICNHCGKDTDGLMTCIPLVGNEIRLCPDCLEKNGGFCLGCGCFRVGSMFAGYCQQCLDEFELGEGDMDTADREYWECENEFNEDDQTF